MKNKSNEKGFALAAVVAIIVVCMILLPALVMWMQQDMKMAVKSLKSGAAFNLAEAGIDRGMWKLKSSTSTMNIASAGTVIAGYNFDTTYADIPGGSYRIKFSSGPSLNQVTIWAEGRDTAAKQTRSIKEVVQNQTIYSALMSGGNITWARGLGVYWGPIISQGNLQLMDDFVGSWYYPKKYARGTVIGSASYPRDTNGLTPPNTDNVEWWSQYDGVPDVPVLDFATLRASAAATGTLNVYGCRSTQGAAGVLGGDAFGQNWDIRTTCTSAGAHGTHFGDPYSHPKSTRLSNNNIYVWYWDGDVTLSGELGPGNARVNKSTGLRGTFIVRGNLTIDTPGEYNYTGAVPANAWEQQNKLLVNTFDSVAANEYPADTGLHSSAPTFNFGVQQWCQPGSSCGWYTTVGLRGFTYVGGNLTILQFMDFNGAVWVNGSVNASGGTATSFCGIFYDDTLTVPALNVVLVRISWNEVTPSSTVWQ